MAELEGRAREKRPGLARGAAGQDGAPRRSVGRRSNEAYALGYRSSQLKHDAGEAGMVTTELALAMPALVGVMLALLWIISLGVGQGVVTQGAREGARAAARGETAAAVRSAVQEIAPGARVSIGHRGDLVVVTTALERRPPFRILHGLSRTLASTAVAHREQP